MDGAGGGAGHVDGVLFRTDRLFPRLAPGKSYRRGKRERLGRSGCYYRI